MTLSDTPYAQDEQSVEQAKVYLRNVARAAKHSLFVVVHDDQDQPAEAWAVKGETWRDLQLIVKRPRQGEDVRLYPGGS